MAVVISNPFASQVVTAEELGTAKQSKLANQSDDTIQSDALAEELLENSTDLLSLNWIVMDVPNKKLHSDIQRSITLRGQAYQKLSSESAEDSYRYFFETLFAARENKASFLMNPEASAYVLNMAQSYPAWIANADSIKSAPTDEARRYAAVMQTTYIKMNVKR